MEVPDAAREMFTLNCPKNRPLVKIFNTCNGLLHRIPFSYLFPRLKLTEESHFPVDSKYEKRDDTRDL